MYYNPNDFIVAKSVFRKQINQPLNCSNEVNLRNSNKTKRSKTDQSNRLNTTTATKKILLDKEYLNLKNLLPMLNNKPKVSKVNLINEAVRYINELQEQVIQKLNADPQIIQQKIIQHIEQQINASSDISQNNDLMQTNTSIQLNKEQNYKNSLRRTPLEEINGQKSVKRKRI